MRIVMHVIQEVVIMRILGAEEFQGFYAAYTTPDGLYYLGHAASLKGAVLNCRRQILDCTPKLRSNQKAYPVKTSDRAAHQANIDAGFTFTDHATGQVSRPLALLANNTLIIETEPRERRPAPRPAPIKARASWEHYTTQTDVDPCDICGGNPEECHYRQTDVDRFTCDNENKTVRSILG